MPEKEVYRKFYEAAISQRKKVHEYVQEYVSKVHLLIFDFPFITHPELLVGRRLFHLPSQRIQRKHCPTSALYAGLRTAIHSIVLYVLSGQCSTIKWAM